MSWKRKRLDELGSISRGRSKHRPRNDPALYNGEYPFIQTADVKNSNFYITDYTQTYNERGLSQSKLWNKGTLCITIAANIADTGILGMDACFPDSIMGFIPYDDKSDVRFIKYCFDILQKNCQQISQGATQDNLSWEKLSTILFPAPSLETQKRIADILSTYDELIEKNQKQLKLLEEATQRLYKEWFVDLRFPGYENTPIVDGVPQGWEVLEIGDVFKTLLGGTPSREKSEYWENGTIPWINSGKVNELRVVQPSEYITDIALNKSATKLLPKHTTLVAITGATLGQVSYTEIETCANQSVVGIVDEKQIHSEYIYCYISDNIKKLIGKATGGAQQHINKDIVNNFPFMVPSMEITKLFKHNVEPLFNKISSLLFMNIGLEEARDRLLPKLMSGELEV